jgi:hypothetical protein
MAPVANNASKEDDSEVTKIHNETKIEDSVLFSPWLESRLGLQLHTPERGDPSDNAVVGSDAWYYEQEFGGLKDYYDDNFDIYEYNTDTSYQSGGKVRGGEGEGEQSRYGHTFGGKGRGGSRRQQDQRRYGKKENIVFVASRDAKPKWQFIITLCCNQTLLIAILVTSEKSIYCSY